MCGCLNKEWSIVIFSLLSIVYISRGNFQECRHFYNSTSYLGGNVGVFNSTKWPSLYPLNQHCLYYFIGQKHERVEVNITHFQLQGVPPQCKFDYLDIYAQVRDLELNSHITSPILGRFCGRESKMPPSPIISTSNIIILEFYSDDHTAAQGFRGKFRFIDSGIYELGTKTPGEYCSFTIYSNSFPSGYIISPTYPGVYPDNIMCSYKLIGNSGERIHITFRDFALFHGGNYCPYDAFTVYDGVDNTAPKIGIFCGEYNTLSFYSSGEQMYMEFRTRQGRMGASDHPYDTSVDYQFKRRGFNITYQFSRNFVKIDNQLPHMMHVKGTVCDMRIISLKQINGTIKSPGYPGDFPINVTCHYYIDGLKNQDRLEKIKVIFQDFSIPGSMPDCNLGYVAINMSSNHHNGEIYNERYCGPYLPPNLISSEPRMVLIFNSHNAQRGRGFAATYHFIPDYGIPGENPVEGKCIFLYQSKTGKKTGTFNSPRHPLRYTDHTNCTYIFRPLPGEKVLISFYTFYLGDKDTQCDNYDYLEIFHEGPNKGDKYSTKHCGRRFPSPILVSHKLYIKFSSKFNAKNSTGFQAKYEFLRPESFYTNCGSTITSSGDGGLIRSPEFPDKYKSRSYCRWTIHASSPDNKILVNFFYFRTEGAEDKQEDSSYGCQNAVMRLYRGSYGEVKPPEEFCGLRDKMVFLSIADTFKLEFVTSSRALGAKGFKMTWTEVHKDGVTCSGFRCSRSEYCIHQDLACNKLPNCGKDDNSDEQEGCPSSTPKKGSSSEGPAVSKFDLIHIAIGASISSFFCIVLVICGLYHRRRLNPEQMRRPRFQPPSDQDTVEVRYVAASSSCNTTDRLLQLDHVDQNGGSTHTSPPNHSPAHSKKNLHNSSQNAVNVTPNQTNPDTTLNQTPSVTTVNTANHNPRTPRIQKVSIV